jgi:hypothetical protein
MSSGVPSHVSDFIKSHSKEAVKQFITYDLLDRMEYHYVATIDVADQGPCMVTQYEYDGTSGRVVKAKESIGVWLAAYEL